LNTSAKIDLVSDIHQLTPLNLGVTFRKPADKPSWVKTGVPGEGGFKKM
jgi:hypothetical protein